ncbi:MAG: thioredoxin [Chloroflexi bacterium]|nr:thioredoxin [Chloroflexota bacterium]
MAKLKEIRHPRPVTANEWRSKVLGAPVPVLVDLWAEWCAPCHAIAPHLNRIAAEYAGRVLVYKLDVDKYPEIAMQYGVQSIPTVLFFYKGQIKDAVVGAAPYQVFRQKVENLLAQVPEVSEEMADLEV